MANQTVSVDRAVVEVSEPAVIALSAAGESRWGYHQFPIVSRLPDGRVLATFYAQDDSVAAHGRSAVPAFVSADEGRTWSRAEAGALPDPCGGHVSACGGDHLFGGREATFDTKDIALPPPAGEIFAYRGIPYYRFEQCPPALQEYVRATPARRWTAAKPAWTPERTLWDTRDALVMVADGGFADKPSIEAPLVEGGGELLTGQYRVGYARENGTLPTGSEAHLLVSRDGGRSFERRSSIRQRGDENITEPVVAFNSRGELVMVFRRADHRQMLPMGISLSKDAGRTWTPLREAAPLGVLPRLLRLDSGPMVMTFGRPGVYLSFSLDGTGDSWTFPLSLKEGTPFDVGGTTCGYTSLLPLKKDTFLLLYSDFRWPAPHRPGEIAAAGSASRFVTSTHYAGPADTCKAILARQIRVRT